MCCIMCNANLDSSLVSCILLFDEARKEILECGCNISNSTSKCHQLKPLNVTSINFIRKIFTSKITLYAYML